MNKFKKCYCVTSLIFAIAVMALSLTRPFRGTVYATSDPSPAVTAGEEAKKEVGQFDDDPEGEMKSATSDINDGFSIVYRNESGNWSGTIKILLVLTVLALAPSILIMVTSFTRIIIVLHFLRTALGTQTAPPNQVLAGLALFLTIFIMNPVITEINENAIKPFDAGQITQEEAFERGTKPLKEFMCQQTQKKDLNVFCDISGEEYETSEDGKIDVESISLTVLIPSFIVSELRAAFILGFIIYIPFIVIDMVVASVLMSMGMMMLPPTTISMPFKILLFVLADGWDLVVVNLVKTFY